MKKIIIPAIAIFLILIVGASAGVTSADQINVQTDTIFGSDKGKMWVLNWNGIDSDKIFASISQSELESETGFKSGQGFTVEMKSGEEYATYKFISSTDKPIKTYNFHANQKWALTHKDVLENLAEWGQDNCADYDEDGNIEWIRKTNYPLYPALGTIYCAKESDLIGTTTGISSPTEIFSTDWIFTPTGKSSESITISNDNNVGQGTSSELGNNVLIRWQGNLKTGARAQEPHRVLGLHSNSFTNGWRVIAESLYDDWQTSLKNDQGMDNCLRRYSSGEVSASFCASQSSIVANAAARQMTTGVFAQPYILDKSFGNGKMKIDLTERVSIPSFQVFVNADYLELILPIGKPQIISVSVPNFAENAVGTITANVKNAGDGRGGFEAGVRSCTKDAEADSIIQTFELDPQETRTLTFRLSGSSTSTTEKEISGSCTFYMKERTTQVEVTKPFDYKYTQVNECTPGNQRATVEGGVWVIKECDSNGLTETTIKICQAGETAFLKAGKYSCESGKPPPPLPNGDGDGKKKSLYDFCVEGKVKEAGLVGKFNPTTKPFAQITCTYDVYKVNLAFGLFLGIIALIALVFRGRWLKPFIASAGPIGWILLGGFVIFLMALAVFNLAAAFILGIIMIIVMLV